MTNSGANERFSVVYRLTGSEKDAYQKAKDICLEQTVEFPEELVPQGFIKEQVVGRIESFVHNIAQSSKNKLSQGTYLAEISFDAKIAADELTQLLNVVFGNISIKPGIRVEKLQLSPSILCNFRGPRFGRSGIREKMGIAQRPLLFTALKPMGLSAEELAELAYKFALGGIDLIKDDHGLTNQMYAPYEERVKRCVEAVERANRETGQKCVYVANVTAPADDVVERARKAKEAGAGGIMVAPALTGFDLMRKLADDDLIGLPIFSHPAFAGSFVTSQENGISHYALFGQINRLAGADGVIYPNYGGRFSFSREECQSIAQGTSEPMGNIRPIFPCPGGGMSVDVVPDMLQVYGQDVIFLIGGGLFRHGPDLVENCKYFRQLVEQG